VKRFGALALVALALGASIGSCTPASRVASAGSVPVALTPATPADEAALCDLPIETRFERARALALDGTPHTRSDEDIALDRWSPRGREMGGAARPVLEGDRPYVSERVRRVLARCIETDAVALTRELVAFQTVAAIAPPSTNAEHARMASFLEAWSAQHGLVFRGHGQNDAWEIELPGRSQERRVRWVVHADVVPVNDPPSVIEPGVVPEGWTHAPFTAELVGDRLYGRGTEDDKGPMAAVMIVLATLASAGLVPDGPLVLAAGTAEEEDWTPMRRYAAESAPARHEISVDSEFPVVTAQSGFVAWGLRIPRAAGRARGAGRRGRARESAEIVSASGGLFLTQIPDAAELVLAPLPPLDAATLEAQVNEAVAAELASRDSEGAGRPHDGFDAATRRETRDGRELVIVSARGVSAHSSQPEDGRNANELLAAIAARLSLRASPATRILEIVHALFDRDLHGTALGLAHEDAFMGPLVVAPTVLRVDESGARIEVNMRRPAGRTAEAFRADLAAALDRVRQRFGRDVVETDDVFVSPVHEIRDAPSIDVLSEVYARLTGTPRVEITPRAIRGGTYARLFAGAVDFGPALPGAPYTGHGADEHITLEALSLTGRAALETALVLGYEP
jgi:dipeptidase D